MQATSDYLQVIPSAVITQLSSPVELDAGGYWGWRREEKSPFVVEMDALPLLVLMAAAFQGVRVYEFMTIGRPGDLLNYLRVRPLSVHGEISQLFAKTEREEFRSRDCGDDYLPFIKFDSRFYPEGDDTTREATCWLAFRSTSFWAETMLSLSAAVTSMQNRLREATDYLIQKEIAQIASRRHRRDFFHSIERRCLAHWEDYEAQHSGTSLLPLLQDLITRANVQSVSCPLTSLAIWRALVEEQLRCSESSGFDPRVAFTLSGPDGGLSAPYEDWGGDVHIPYEGACGADLFIKPTWRRVFQEVDGRGGSLSDVVFDELVRPEMGYVCHYLLTQEDLGPLQCATRREVGDGWVLYESNRLYERNLLFKG